MKDNSTSDYTKIEGLNKDYKLMEAEISTFMFDFDKKKKFVYYIVKCRYTKSIKWEVKRRYQ